VSSFLEFPEFGEGLRLARTRLANFTMFLKVKLTHKDQLLWSEATERQTINFAVLQVDFPGRGLHALQAYHRRDTRSYVCRLK
jgi:hypothetical protein